MRDMNVRKESILATPSALRERNKELEVALAKKSAELEGYKDGRGVDYTKYIAIGVASIETVALVIKSFI
jgi:hypothetical protein